VAALATARDALGIRIQNVLVVSEKDQGRGVLATRAGSRYENY
jgi:hypothetical protein